MTLPDKVVFLFDVDNTLLNNDRVLSDFRHHLESEFGSETCRRYFAILQELYAELGYADYLGALQRYRLEDISDPRLLLMSSFLVDYPFASRLYPGSLAALAHVRRWGETVILSDGDVVFQPRKVERSGLWDAVEGRVLVYIHKEQMLEDIERRYPAHHYVMIDDKLRILSAMKTIWGERLTTLWCRQGHYALDAKPDSTYPPPDLTIERIADLINCDFSKVGQTPFTPAKDTELPEVQSAGKEQERPGHTGDQTVTSPAGTDISRGLTTSEAQARLAQFGPNAVVEEKSHPFKQLIRHLWAPIPWLLEATIIIQLFLGDHVEAALIGALLIANALISFLQEGQAQKALSLLRQQLRVEARVRRDGVWTTVPAEVLVPGDIIHMRQGSIVPADVMLKEGSLLVDQSALTGESASVSVATGKAAYAGSMVRGSEATGEVTATGARTFFGKTAELVRTAGSANRQEHEISGVARNLFVVNGAMMAIVAGYAFHAGMSLGHILPLLLTILLASIPVALPATFSFSAALGSVELSRHGVLITRLSALHDIASMTVLCSDKTGTLTRNEATVHTTWAAPGFSESELLRAAALASDPAGQDPVDRAAIKAAMEHGYHEGELERIDFKPFDPATKRSETLYRSKDGLIRYVKGAPAVVATLTGVAKSVWQPQEEAIVRQGQRVLAVAMGTERQLRLLGLVGFEDAVREDSKAVVSAIRDLGVRTVMMTGDNALTAQSVAEQVGIPTTVCSPDKLRANSWDEVVECSVFAGVFPEDKIKLVRAFQRHGAVVGMSGDGVNDSPALRQAEAGLAVANATDVAKGAAAMVLTRPGLSTLVPAIETSRRVFQRIITYTFSMLIKKIEIMALLVIGFLVTGQSPLTPMLMVLILFLSDFLTMSISTDRMGFSHRPNHWNTRGISLVSLVLAVCKLVFSLGVFLYGYYTLRLPIRTLQTLTFATLIFSTQAAIFFLRERRHFWNSRPSLFLIVGSVFGMGTTAILTLGGILMPAITPFLLFVTVAAGVVYFACLDWLKIWLFSRFDLR